MALHAYKSFAPITRPDRSRANPSDRSPVNDGAWIVERYGLRVGPLTTVQLALAAKTGLLHPSDVIWQPGLTHRYAAGDVPGLLPALPPPERVEPSRQLPSRPPPSRTVAVVNRAYSSSDLVRVDPPAVAGRYPPRAAPYAGLPEPTALMPMKQHRAVAPTTVDGENTTVTLRLAEAIARHIVFILKYQDIRTLDDLANDERLRGIAVAVVDALPGSLRLIVTRSVGRAFVEARIVGLLKSLRSKLPPSTRTAELHQIILGQAPLIAQRIDERIAAAANRARSRWKETWRSTVEGLARLRKPSDVRMLPAAE